MPKHIVREYPLSFSVTDHSDPDMSGSVNDACCFPEVGFCGLCVRSSSLYKHLEGCEKVLLFAATLGNAPDRLIRRSSVSQVSSALIYQAAAAEMIEAYCDRVNEMLEDRYATEGRRLRQRFSPGYGDLSLELQRDIIRILNTPKAIGLTLTDSLIMIPTKSVTAIIGVERAGSDTKAEACAKNTGRCDLCGFTDCPYRAT